MQAAPALSMFVNVARVWSCALFNREDLNSWSCHVRIIPRIHALLDPAPDNTILLTCLSPERGISERVAMISTRAIDQTYIPETFI